MTTGQLCLFPLILSVLSLQSVWAEEVEIDPFAPLSQGEEAVVKAEAAKLIEKLDPDYLVPVDAEPADWQIRYAEQLRKRLDLMESLD